MALGTFKAVVLAGGLALASQAQAQTPSPTVGLLTVADGPVEVVRGGARFEAREGTPLQAQDIVRTLLGTRMVRLETSQGAAIDLGSATQVLLYPATSPWPGERQATAYLATGWAKLSEAAQAPASNAPVGLATASAHITPNAAGVVLVQVQGGASSPARNIFVFVETGAAQLSEYPTAATPKKAAQAKAVLVTVNEGQAYRRAAAQSVSNLPGDLLARASATALAEVPAALRDSLPRRTARFAGAAAPQVAYKPLQGADLAVWAQVAEPLRTLMARRFALPVPAQAAEPPTAQASVPPALIPALAPAVQKVALAPARAKPAAVRVAKLAARNRKPVIINTAAVVYGNKSDKGVAMLFERDASAPESLNAVKPGEATARSFLPETNTRIAETNVAAPTLPALAAPVVASVAPPPAPAAAPAPDAAPRGRTAATGSPR
jgi:hypothetical protein